MRQFAVVLACGWFSLACAEQLSNPTRPPQEWLALGMQPSSQTTAMPAPDFMQSLQLLLVGHTRKFAVIDGQVIKVGDSYNGSKVLGIKRDGVVFEGEGGPKSLKLAPSIEKRVILSDFSSGPTGKAAGTLSRKKVLVIGEGK